MIVPIPGAAAPARGWAARRRSSVGGTKKVERRPASTRSKSSSASNPPEGGSTWAAPRARNGSDISPEAWLKAATWIIESAGPTASASAR